MAEQNDSSGTAPRGSGGGRGGGNSGGGGGGGGGSGGGNRNRNRNRNRSRNRSGQGSGTASGSGGNRSGGNATAQKKNQGRGGGGQRPQSQSQSRGRGGQGGGNRSRDRSGPQRAQPRTAVALAPPPPAPLDVQPSLGAPEVFPAEVAANRRRVLRLCAWTAAIPAVLLGLLLWVSVSLIAGIAAFVVAGAGVMYGLWRLAPSVALRRIGAVPIDEHDDPRLTNITDGLCATFGLSMPSLNVVHDDVPNACALGRDARRADLVVTTGLLRLLQPIELEGVIAHELAHVKRGDNGVSCIGITLGTLFGGEKTLRRCVGESREYRADVVGASSVRYPRGLLNALTVMMEAPPPAAGSFFAAPSRFGSTRWVWIDPSVGHRGDAVAPGDLDATSVRVAALREW